jgi:hypothetical protein
MGRCYARWCEKKKLIEAARYWAAGSPAASEGAEGDLEVLRVSLEDPNAVAWLAQIAPVIEHTEFEIYPENLLALEVFLALQTQWNVIAGMSGVIYQGVNYQALNSVFSMLSIPSKDRPALFQDIRVMEQAAIVILNSAS